MMAADTAQIVAAALYAALAGAVVYARRSWSRVPASPSLPVIVGENSWWSEALWLGALASVFAYPLGILLFPRALLTSPLTIRFPGDEIVQVGGILLVLVGAVLSGWALRSLGRFTTVRIQLTADQSLITGGPYRWIRHPMYTANLLLALGVTLTFLSLTLWISVGVVSAIAFLRANREERMFLASPRLGPEYAAYRRATGRFLPRFRRTPSIRR